MANKKGKVNPTVANVHRPNLRPESGQGNPPNDNSREHIKGAASSNKPPRKKSV